MPHQSLKLIPGVDTTKTLALNESAISQSQRIRFISDRTLGGIPQKLGGWTKFINQRIDSRIHALHAWADTNSVNVFAVGAELGVYAGNPSSGLSNVSQQKYEADRPCEFSTTIGSNLVTVNDVGSNLSNGDSIYLMTQVSVGGLVLSGYYKVRAVSADTYQIYETDIIGNPINATSTEVDSGQTPIFTTVSGDQEVAVEFDNHGYSQGDTFTTLVSTTIGNITIYGNYVINSIVDADNFTIYADRPASSSSSAQMNGGLTKSSFFLGQQASMYSGGFGSGGFGAGGFGVGVVISGTSRQIEITSATTVGTLATFQFTEMVNIPPGSRVNVSGMAPTGYNGSWNVISSTVGVTNSFTADIGTTPIDSTLGGEGSITYFGPESANDWSLDNWGEDLIACAYLGNICSWKPSLGTDHLTIIPNSPIVNEGVFVAMPQRQIIAYGSTFTGIQDPLLVRWCDVGNNQSWIATVVNQAGSYRISKGSKIIGAIQGPQQGLIWTDVGLWSMQYIGQPLIYSFNEIAFGCGLVGRKAMGVISGVVYWMSQSQFFVLSGDGASPLPCPIWDTVFQQIDSEP